MKPEIRALTGLRGVAATLVMVDHYAAVDFTAGFPLRLLPHMYLAVDLFMLLSGFVLAMSYEDRLARLPAAEAYRLFLLRRVARLYPLYALATLASFVLCRAGWLSFLHPDHSAGALLANLLAVQTWIWPGSSLDGPGWSISTEWFANLAFPLLLPVVLGRSAAAAGWAAGLSFAVLVWSALAWGQLFDVPSPGAANIISGPEALGRCVPEFVLGMACWRVRSRAAWARRLAGDRAIGALLLLLAVLIQWTELDTVFVAVCAPLLVGLSFEASAAARGLRHPALLFLGRISYSIYLVHIPLLPLRDALARTFAGWDVPGAWACAVLCTALAVLAVATMTRRWVEQPAQSAILSLLRARRVRHA